MDILPGPSGQNFLGEPSGNLDSGQGKVLYVKFGRRKVGSWWGAVCERWSERVGSLCTKYSNSANRTMNISITFLKHCFLILGISYCCWNRNQLHNFLLHMFAVLTGYFQFAFSRRTDQLLCTAFLQYTGTQLLQFMMSVFTWDSAFLWYRTQVNTT
jgi:hypothetical protein